MKLYASPQTLKCFKYHFSNSNSYFPFTERKVNHKQSIDKSRINARFPHWPPLQYVTAPLFSWTMTVAMDSL